MRIILNSLTLTALRQAQGPRGGPPFDTLRLVSLSNHRDRDDKNKYPFIWYFGEIGVTLQPECRNCLSEASKLNKIE